ncbi:Multimeric flavodoxin WrbA [Microbulbifer donghaiensis]|uniref:Multimeric flavodoxin WrbA n=1 Tax=Microbulbifer donghaiensis TaxID=494016 RepID=A0A1M4V300_9GAMM|nr:flavodoxin family protein [Microbulbifer donghaiensis]SHE63371.1 Multimeric flavodoxin WrbA [Microbulbifer donghaiensis]
MKIGVVYYSATGTTATLAQAVAAGVRTIQGAAAVPLEIMGTDIEEGRYKNEQLLQQLDACNGIVFGSPTFMGSVAAPFKAFMDATSERYGTRAWAGKVAAGFTIGGSPSGDQLNTLQTLNVFACQHGMLWVGLDLPGGWDAHGRNRLGALSGLVAQQTEDGKVHHLDRLTAMYLGERVARIGAVGAIRQDSSPQCIGQA